MHFEFPFRHPLLAQIAEERLIAVVRTPDPDSAVWVSEQLIQAGARVVEITLTIPDAVDVLEHVSARFPEVLFGAGSVLQASQALQALGAGARFLVSPILLDSFIQFGQEQEILVLPAGMTPTEIERAWSLGAPAVKFFPAQSVGGASFVQALRGPLPHVPLVPTGGIQLTHLHGYLQAGALAVGVGGPMMPADLVQARDAQRLQAVAQPFFSVCQHFSATRCHQP